MMFNISWNKQRDSSREMAEAQQKRQARDSARIANPTPGQLLHALERLEDAPTQGSEARNVIP